MALSYLQNLLDTTVFYQVELPTLRRLRNVRKYIYRGYGTP